MHTRVRLMINIYFNQIVNVCSATIMIREREKNRLIYSCIGTRTIPDFVRDTRSIPAKAKVDERQIRSLSGKNILRLYCLFTRLLNILLSPYRASTLVLPSVWIAGTFKLF